MDLNATAHKPVASELRSRAPVTRSRCAQCVRPIHQEHNLIELESPREKCPRLRDLILYDEFPLELRHEIYEDGPNPCSSHTVLQNDQAGERTARSESNRGHRPEKTESLPSRGKHEKVDRTDDQKDSYYRNSPVENPHGPTEGKKRVLRGGSWKLSESACRATISRFISSLSGPIELPSPMTSSVTPCRMSLCERPSSMSDSFA